MFELGLYSFGENTPDPISGNLISTQERFKNLLETIVLADQVGLDVFGLGEHHRADFPLSSPPVFLAAAASLTKRIRLTSAVTVLSSEDPVRVFQQFSTLDLLSQGRAEITAGRGSFIESFGLFGFDLKDYNELFAEKLEMLVALRDQQQINWQGKFTQTLQGQGVFPRPIQEKLPIWVAVGGTPQSVVRAAVLGLPLALAIIGGSWQPFVGFADLYRRAWAQAGHKPEDCKISINSHGYIAENSQQALHEFYPAFKSVMDKIGLERGWQPTNRAQFEQSREVFGANFIGDPEEISEKILLQHQAFGHQRLLFKLDLGTMPHSKTMNAIELFGTKVAPKVRAALHS